MPKPLTVHIVAVGKSVLLVGIQIGFMLSLNGAFELNSTRVMSLSFVRLLYLEWLMT